MTTDRTDDFDKDKFDAFMTLADYRMKRSFNRHQYEWRISFAVWALLAAATLYLHPRPPDALFILVLVAIVFLHCYFIVEVRKRNRLDTETAFYYVELAERTLALPNIEVRDRPSVDKAMAHSLENVIGVLTQDSWWNGLHLAVTVALALCCYWLTGTLSKSN